MDFDDERRLEVVEHVRQLYGPEKVTHVITVLDHQGQAGHQRRRARSGLPGLHGPAPVQDGLERPQGQAQAGARQKPGKEDLFNPDFAEAYKKDDDARRIIDTALSIEGLTRGEGVHACAVLICRDPVNEHVPTKLDTKGGVEITQYEGHYRRRHGPAQDGLPGPAHADGHLLRRSRTSANIVPQRPPASTACRMQAKACIKPGATCVDIDAAKVDFSDPRSHGLLGKGHTAGVFQVESAGMTATIKNMKPTEYKHVVALIALYRPGPLGAGMVSSYINRMNGKEPASTTTTAWTPILERDLRHHGLPGAGHADLRSKMCGVSQAGESDSRMRKPVAKKKIKLLTDQVLPLGGERRGRDHLRPLDERRHQEQLHARGRPEDLGRTFSSSHLTPLTSRTPPATPSWLCRQRGSRRTIPHEYMAARF